VAKIHRRWRDPDSRRGAALQPVAVVVPL